MQDSELESIWKILEKLAVVNNIPRVLSEIKKRNWIISPSNVSKIVEKELIHENRGDFNSPVHVQAKKFEF